MVRGPMIAQVTVPWRSKNAIASSIRLILAWPTSPCELFGSLKLALVLRQ